MSKNATRLRHGSARVGARTHEYRCWQSMKSRCQNVNDKNYDRYGARGISLCERWSADFESFLADMGPAPTPKHTVDRKDNALGYDIGNCRWATQDEQQQNRTNTRLDAGKVADIRRRLAGGETARSIALVYGVHFETVGYIRRGHTWKNVGLLFDATEATP